MIQAKFSTVRIARRQRRNDKIHTFLNISLPLYTKYGIRASKMVKMRISKYISSDLSGFKYNSYWNEILFVTNCSYLSFLILSKNLVPTSSIASRLAQTQVFFLFDFFTFFSSSNMNSSIIQLCLWSRKWKLFGKNVKFSNLASLVALGVWF